MAASTLHGPFGRTEGQRFADMTGPPDGAGCLPWVGGKKKAGYGQMAVKRNGKWTRVIAHRYAYELAHGAIPEGYEIDHRCRNRSCVNAGHLEAVTLAENRRRRNAAKTACANGHPWTDESTYRWVDRDGYDCRFCRICRRASS